MKNGSQGLILLKNEFDSDFLHISASFLHLHLAIVAKLFKNEWNYWSEILRNLPKERVDFTPHQE